MKRKTITGGTITSSYWWQRDARRLNARVMVSGVVVTESGTAETWNDVGAVAEFDYSNGICSDSEYEVGTFVTPTLTIKFDGDKRSSFDSAISNKIRLIVGIATPSTEMNDEPTYEEFVLGEFAKSSDEAVDFDGYYTTVDCVGYLMRNIDVQNYAYSNSTATNHYAQTTLKSALGNDNTPSLTDYVYLNKALSKKITGGSPRNAVQIACGVLGLSIYETFDGDNEVYKIANFRTATGVTVGDGILQKPFIDTGKNSMATGEITIESGSLKFAWVNGVDYPHKTTVTNLDGADYTQENQYLKATVFESAFLPNVGATRTRTMISGEINMMLGDARLEVGDVVSIDDCEDFPVMHINHHYDGALTTLINCPKPIRGNQIPFKNKTL